MIHRCWCHLYFLARMKRRWIHGDLLLLLLLPMQRRRKKKMHPSLHPPHRVQTQYHSGKQQSWGTCTATHHRQAARPP